jgi:transcriptional regulator with XRE-family HTH domain
MQVRHMPDVDGRLIRLHRMLRGKTVTQVAKEVGVATSLVSRWETGDRQPSPRALIRLAAALDAPFTDLLDDADEAPKAITLLGEPTGGVSSWQWAARHRATAAAL